MKTTSWKVVIPFYVYAALSLLVASVLLLCSVNAFLYHYFQPNILAITHIMALGWGTMIILGSAYQLIPVLIESNLYSEKLALLSFLLAGIGIPMLAYGFYFFEMTSITKFGAILIVIAIILFLINAVISVMRSKAENIHAVYVITAVIWLLLTALLGVSLIYNFTSPILNSDSLLFLPLHAHLGIIGWFLLLVIGVGSRLIPMFLVSKYTNNRVLWLIYLFINAALILYIVIFIANLDAVWIVAPLCILLIGLLLFGKYCYDAYRQRIRKKLDGQMKVSLLSVLSMLLPVLILMFVIIFSNTVVAVSPKIILAYGFLIFFGWLTAIILAMTFKTLPFIVWTKVYHHKAQSGKAPSPKDMFSQIQYKWMIIFYYSGILLFVTGITVSLIWLLQMGAIALLIGATLYVSNIVRLVFHKPVVS